MTNIKSDRMDYDSVYQFFDTLHFVFETGDEEGIDDRCQALWVLFLASVNWSQEEFWEEWDKRNEGVCHECGRGLSNEASDDKKNSN